jgi:hypothetical protein
LSFFENEQVFLTLKSCRGNVIVILGTTLAVLGLTWGGVHYSWKSAHVLAPLLIGFGLIAFFVAYEVKVPKVPTIPFQTLGNRTTISGYFATTIHGITSIAIICMSALDSPILSSIVT